jgi:hypothetical protein
MGGAAFTLSPDGARAALVLRRADSVSNRYCFGVVVVTLATGAMQLLDTGGEPIFLVRDFRSADFAQGGFDHPPPSWSPDGRALAYLRRDGGITRLWRVGLEGGVAQAVPTGPDDVRRFAWSVDGSALLFATRPGVAAAQAAIMGEGRHGYHYDERFWTMSDAAPRPAPGIPYVYQAFELASAARRLATAAEQQRIDAAPPAGVPVGAERYAREAGGVLAWIERRDPARFLGATRLVAARRGQRHLCDAPACADKLIGLWWEGPDKLLFLRDWGGQGLGRVELFSWVPGRAPISVTRLEDSPVDCSLSGTSLVCALERSVRPRRIARIALPDGRITDSFDPNPEFADVRLGDVTRLAAHAADGTPTFADLVLPPGHRAGDRHPLVIVQYTSRGFLRGGTGNEYPVHLFATQGYAVLSFHRTPAVAIGQVVRDSADVQRIGMQGFAERTRLFTALQSAVDAAVATGTIDPDAIGITGMSDGASTAIWAILHDRRYRVAAISQCCEDPYPSFFGNGLAYRKGVERGGYPPPDRDPAGFWKAYSLAERARDVSAPLLVQIADREFRFALQGVGALAAAGKPVEMYVFPNEYHTKWQPVHRAAVFRRSIAWFDFWLRGIAEPEDVPDEELSRWQALARPSPSQSLGLEPGLDRDKPMQPGPAEPG